MPRYMIEVEAVQFGFTEYGEKKLAFFQEPPEWVNMSLESGRMCAVTKGEDYYYLKVATPMGDTFAGPGDWIIRGALGEFHVLEDKIFKAIYEEVTD